MTLPDEREWVRGKGVEGVSCLMQQGHDIVHQTDRVHEDERPAMEVERFAVATRRLALAALEIEQALVDHGLELSAERGMHPIEDLLGLAHQIGSIGERAQRIAAVGVNRQIPGPQNVQPQTLAADARSTRSTAGAAVCSIASWNLSQSAGV